jgi:hypothetical protein
MFIYIRYTFWGWLQCCWEAEMVTVINFRTVEILALAMHQLCIEFPL